MYGEGLHQDFSFDNQLYPGSTPGGDWNLSFLKVPDAEWMEVAEDGNVLFTDGSIYQELADIALENMVGKSKRGGRRFLMWEEERDPVLIETQNVILR